MIANRRAPGGASAPSFKTRAHVVIRNSHFLKGTEMRAEDRVDAMLDHALEMTFPASDPFTIYFPEVASANEAVPVERELGLEAAA